MFGKKLIAVLCTIVAVLLAAKAVIVVVMFAWSFGGVPPLEVVNSTLPLHVRWLLVIQELGSAAFLYAVTAAVNSLAGGSLKGKKK